MIQTLWLHNTVEGLKLEVLIYYILVNMVCDGVPRFPVHSTYIVVSLASFQHASLKIWERPGDEAIYHSIHVMLICPYY